MARKKEKDAENGTEGKNQDLPGYPHYPPDDDIMNPQHGFKKISADDEIANSVRLSGNRINERNSEDELEPREEDDDLKIVEGTEADVTDEDLKMLGDMDEDQDMGEDELVGNARVDQLEEEESLDIPGAQLDDENEEKGEEDEENNYYSLGGDRHENLEEDPNAQD